jgi:hypothetical protein
MTTTEAQQLASGDEVGQGHYCGIVMRATPKSVSIFWETQKMGETTTYSKGSAELRGIVLKHKAPQKAVGAQRNGGINGDSHRSNGMASPCLR